LQCECKEDRFSLWRLHYENQGNHVLLQDKVNKRCKENVSFHIFFQNCSVLYVILKGLFRLHIWYSNCHFKCRWLSIEIIFYQMDNFFLHILKKICLVPETLDIIQLFFFSSYLSCENYLGIVPQEPFNWDLCNFGCSQIFTQRTSVVSSLVTLINANGYFWDH
jgi:hypothetical protein